jgi:hypothetical protein
MKLHLLEQKVKISLHLYNFCDVACFEFGKCPGDYIIKLQRQPLTVQYGQKNNSLENQP